MRRIQPNQELSRKLEIIGAKLEQAADDALGQVKEYQGAELIEVLKLITKLYEDVARLKVISDELKQRYSSDSGA